MRQEEETALVDRAKCDPEAFGELYERYFERIYAFGYARLKTRAEAEDATSDVFLTALRGLPGAYARGMADGLRVSAGIMVAGALVIATFMPTRTKAAGQHPATRESAQAKLAVRPTELVLAEEAADISPRLSRFVRVVRCDAAMGLDPPGTEKKPSTRGIHP